MVADNDWSAVVKNLSWVMTAWRRMLRILSREGAAPQLSDFFLNAVVQAVLLFRSDTWVVTPRMGKALGEGFQSQVAKRLTGRILWRTLNRECKYTLEAMAKEEAGS